ncbi:hypothetical protein Clacol_007213 [Clathrus columnatus]|uniref:NAD(P)-binding protein n=1 Tax=Clathrus columnatus TaxID=1419009 RepID=A0AAV5AKJ0_9AGAM|nr:hypothetical protein Clacol_007213 [Clathrus columnatus]
MPSYLITGASRGIGLIIVHKSVNPENLVYALVRNLDTAQRIEALSEWGNIRVVKGDITDPDALKIVAEEVSKGNNGKLDVLINNAAYIDRDSASVPLTEFHGKENLLEKVLLETVKSFFIYFEMGAVIHTINAFLPLLQAGEAKKVITLSTGLADPDFSQQTGYYLSAPYSISKAATNMVITKYSVQFKKDGFIFVAISPGLVDTVGDQEISSEELAGYQVMLEGFRKIKPTFEGAISPEESVKAQLAVIDRLTVKDTGAFLSHHGNKEWL